MLGNKNSKICSPTVAITRVKAKVGKNKAHLNKKGFTLVELVVVIMIIGLLSASVIVVLNSSRTSGRDAKRLSDIKSYQAALEIYKDRKGAYPTSLNDLKTENVITSLPIDPINTSPYVYLYNRIVGPPEEYQLTTTLEKKDCSTTDARSSIGQLCVFKP